MCPLLIVHFDDKFGAIHAGIRARGRKMNLARRISMQELQKTFKNMKTSLLTRRMFANQYFSRRPKGKATARRPANLSETVGVGANEVGRLQHLADLCGNTWPSSGF